MSTNNATSTRFRFITVVAIVLLFLTFSLTQTFETHAISISELQSEASRLEEEIANSETYIAQLRKKQDTLKNKIAAFNVQIKLEQDKINLTQANINKLELQIKEAKRELKRQKGLLRHTLVTLYKEGDISTIEMLASSDNYTQFINQQEYLSRLKDQVRDSADKVKKLKEELEIKKVEQDELLSKQKAQRASLTANRKQQQKLLDKTAGEEARYQQIVANNRTRLETVAAQQRAYFASLGSNNHAGVVGSFQYTNWSGNMGCGNDGYPYCGPQDSYTDPWQLYNRECVSYVAWALSSRYNRHVSSFNGEGNAYEWAQSAPTYSGAYVVSNPQPGDAVVLPQSGGFAPIGHLMIVEQSTASTPSGWVHVSQYNFYGTGEYSTMDIATTGVIFLRFLPN